MAIESHDVEVRMPRESAATVLRRHETELRGVPEVAGVGLGEDAEGEVLVVFVRHGVTDLEEVRARVPAQLDGYRTEIRPEVRVFE